MQKLSSVSSRTGSGPGLKKQLSIKSRLSTKFSNMINDELAMSKILVNKNSIDRTDLGSPKTGNLNS